MRRNKNQAKDYYLTAIAIGVRKSKKFKGKFRSSYYPEQNITASSMSDLKPDQGWCLNAWEDNPLFSYDQECLPSSVKPKLNEAELVNELEIESFTNRHTSNIFTNDWISNFEAIKFGRLITQ